MGVFNDLAQKIFETETADEVDKTRFSAFLSDAQNSYRELVVKFSEELAKLKEEKREEFVFLGLTVALFVGSEDNDCELKPEVLALLGTKKNITKGVTAIIAQLSKEKTDEKHSNTKG